MDDKHSEVRDGTFAGSANNGWRLRRAYALASVCELSFATRCTVQGNVSEST